MPAIRGHGPLPHTRQSVGLQGVLDPVHDLYGNEAATTRQKRTLGAVAFVGWTTLHPSTASKPNGG